MKQLLSSIGTASFFLLTLFSCQKETGSIQQRGHITAVNSSNNSAEEKSKKIYVGNVEGLYTAVNDVTNAGSTIVLAPGTYALNASYSNGGRLELQHDMSLLGQPGHPETVIIDVSALPLSSIISPQGRTGIVRLGDGANNVEWVTIENNPAHATIRSLIQTDIVTTPVASIRIAHCILKGSSIGLNIINRDVLANGRIVEAVIEDNEIINNTVTPFGSGIQIQNSTAVNNAVIRATLSRNYIHGNRAGVLAFNASSKGCTIEIRSNADNIQNNGLGLMFNGGFIENANNQTLENQLRFDAYASTIAKNAGNPSAPFLFPACGVYAAGGEAFPPFGVPGTANRNKLEMSFHGCAMQDNIGSAQLIAYGGHSFHVSSVPVGSNNTTTIYLDGVSKNASVDAVASYPAEAAGTNTVSVYK